MQDSLHCLHPPPPALVGGGVVEASHHPGPFHQQAYSVNTARERERGLHLDLYGQLHGRGLLQQGDASPELLQQAGDS